ncbi:MAG: histidine triad nucleotide-binding protein [Rhodocyclaceae bacterium]|nr:histidine triad nucleotide-binding protein [Rhodocyclaceae bacterium]MBX3669311.1 histidine triad nucleotide-binding protein [Rhodocyclaceae bacterium]
MSAGACIFCKIARNEIPAKKVYEDAEVFAFNDIRPQAPVHFLVVPRQHIVSLAEVDATHAALLGKMFTLIGQLARAQGCENGFRTIVNTGRVGGQEVYHLHVHVIGGSEPLPAMLKW